MDITTEIEKIIQSTFKTKPGLSKFYKKYFSLINFTIIYSIGMLFYMLLQNFNWILSVIILLLWTYSMTVGPFSYMWGFTPKKEQKIIVHNADKTLEITKEQFDKLYEESSK